MRTHIYVLILTCSVVSMQAMLWSGPARSMVISTLRMHAQQRFVSSSVATAEYEWMGMDGESAATKAWRAEKVKHDLNEVKTTYAKYANDNGCIKQLEFIEKLHFAATFPLLAAFKELNTLNNKIDSILSSADRLNVEVDRDDLTAKQDEIQWTMFDLKRDERYYQQHRENLQCHVIEAQLELLRKK